MFSFIKKIHFVGIGGSGMSGIAEVLNNLGYKISGSDIQETLLTKMLESQGIKINIGHSALNINDDVELVVISTAISMDNPEVVIAKSKNIPVIPRAEMLAELMRLKYSILIAGTHGKTTTTSMISWLMYKLDFDPTIIIGGKLNNIGTGAKIGNGKFFVAEADESDGSFLKYNPIVAVLTNIDNDHLDYYGNMDNLENSFLNFVNKIPFYGFSVSYNDDQNIRKLIKKTNRKNISYGIENESDVMAKNFVIKDGKNIFDVYKKGNFLGKIVLSMPGKYNILNALAAITVLLEFNVDFERIALAFLDFKGVGRRLEIKGQKENVLVIDDYGHHPTEMKSVWNSIKNFYEDRQKIVVFQPHRYSRTKILAEEFAKVLKDMDKVLLLPIYPAGEIDTEKVDLGFILKFLSEKEKEKIICFQQKKDVEIFLDEKLDTKEKSLILTLGAGDVYKIGENYLGI
ncbi:MAG: UDP-N-acetylmuramate--L-alanine ligase [Elusimicrobiota bacterium]|jgi:UDP-N-acetylmuramate--alanine ligase|nr:UDP-N-acetylmuramate--L-alanine ligase [Elusimicrobiota bacterium]